MNAALYAYFANRTTPLKIVIYWQPYQELIKFLLAKRFYFGCLSQKHIARLCPERKICKIPNCTGKHLTVLHASNVREKSSVDVGIGIGDSTDTPVLNALANAGECSSSLDLGKRVLGQQ